MSKIRGQIRCGTIPYRFGPGILHPDGSISKRYPQISRFSNINITSGGDKYKVLSPMKLGPFVVIEKRIMTPWYSDGIHPGFQAVNDTHQQATTTNLENYWQGSKIYPQDIVNGIIQLSFYQRRAKMMADSKPHRRALPKSQGSPIAAYFDGNILNYVPSRIYYIMYYSYLVQLLPEYQDLVRRLESGENLQILGFDGYDPASGLPYGANPITYEVLERAMYDPKRPFGHELVLCGILLGNCPWENFKC